MNKKFVVAVALLASGVLMAGTAMAGVNCETHKSSSYGTPSFCGSRAGSIVGINGQVAGVFIKNYGAVVWNRPLVDQWVQAETAIGNYTANRIYQATMAPEVETISEPLPQAIPTIDCESPADCTPGYNPN